MYQIQTDNVNEASYANKHLIFLGRKKKAHSTMIKTKKVINKMKGELNGEIIEEFDGLRAKMYSLKTKKK